MRVFVSYRRSDVGGHAGRLSDALGQRLGAKNVFQDVSAIAPGQDFAAAISGALDGCDAALAVIGPGWLTASTPGGRPRLLEPDDYVRLELATVLQRNLPVIPVLVGGASLPEAAGLPEDLRPLLRHQSIVLHDEMWRQDVENLVRSLLGESMATPRRRRAGIVVGAVVLAAVVGLVFWRPWAGGSSGDGGSAAALPFCPDTTGAGWTALALASSPSGARAEPQGGEYTFTVSAARWRPLAAGQWELVVDTAMKNATPASAIHGHYWYGSLTVAERAFPQTCFNATQRESVQPGTIDDGRIGYLVTCEPKGLVELFLDGGTKIRLTDSAIPSSC